MKYSMCGVFILHTLDFIFIYIYIYIYIYIFNKDLNDQASELPTEIDPEMQQSNSCMVDVEIESDESVIDNHIPENSRGVSEAFTISRVGQVCDSNTQLDFSQSGPTTENTKTVIQIPKVKQVIKYQLLGSETWIKA